MITFYFTLNHTQKYRKVIYDKVYSLYLLMLVLYNKYQNGIFGITNLRMHANNFGML